MPQRTATQLREDAQAIWRAGVEAVASDRLVREHVHVDGLRLQIADQILALDTIRRICVVGAGKAGAGMAQGLEEALGIQLLRQKQVTGWINVPADCIRPLTSIHLHAARPAGVNEPTAEGVEGGRRILELVTDLDDQDLCIVLLSGGGSALLPAPAEGITLPQKLAVTRHLSSAGANIAQLNAVRKQLSAIKGGRLARACRAGRLITLIISDVLGDPLDVIASGPTVASTTTAQDALQVLDQFPLPDPALAQTIQSFLRQRGAADVQPQAPRVAGVTNVVIGNNAVAVDAAGMEALRRGYSHAMVAATSLEGEAEQVGRHLARLARQMRDTSGQPDCLITGGEPTVTLAAPAVRGLGGRNQQLVLAALHELTEVLPTPPDRAALEGLVILAGGTDGEDGPTDAAGAWADEPLENALRSHALDPQDYLRGTDAYHFFAPLGTLLKTGPTHTNVCDLRVVVVSRES